MQRDKLYNYIFFYISICFLMLVIFSTNIVFVKAYMPLEDLKDNNGNFIYYRNTSVNVQIPKSYQERNRDFRAAWVSPFINDITVGTDASYKRNFTEVLDIMEYYNLNVLIYHVRINNDAMYHSNLNPQASYVQYLSSSWDSLAWLIEETHKRGMEFHAWLNPYRVRNLGVSSLEALASTFPSYNIASNPDYMLKTQVGGAILNPGEPEVRQFLIDTVMEIVHNYDVDAIHFDDYFYADIESDEHTRSKYNPDNLSVTDWRRRQVDIFIKDLSDALYNYNYLYNKHIQLGISPTGIYRNSNTTGPNGGPNIYNTENGNFLVAGSNSLGQEHFGDYIYSDTKKWVDNEWIDYIMPQVYWSFTDPRAPYADVVDWWSKVVKNKKVNLYIGIGLSKASESDNHSWGSNPLEVRNQILYNFKHETVQGAGFFSFKYLRWAYNNQGPEVLQIGLDRLRNEIYYHKVLQPELRRSHLPLLLMPSKVSYNSYDNYNQLSFTGDNRARGYVIYRSSSKYFTYNNDEIITIINQDNQGIITYQDYINNANDYYYAVRSINQANYLSEPLVISDQEVVEPIEPDPIEPDPIEPDPIEPNPIDPQPNDPILKSYISEIELGDNVNNSLLKIRDVKPYYGLQNSLEVKELSNYRYLFLTDNNKVVSTNNSYTFYNTLSHDFKAYFVREGKYGVAFVDSSYNLISFQAVNNIDEIVYPPDLDDIVNYTFSHWSHDLTQLNDDVIIKAIYKPIEKVSFTITVDNGYMIQSYSINYGERINLDIPITLKDDFSHWEIDGEIASLKINYEFSCYSDIYIKACFTNNQADANIFLFDEVFENNGSLHIIANYSLSDDVIFLEAGIIIDSYYTPRDFNLLSSDVTSIRALRISKSNEFAIKYQYTDSIYYRGYVSYLKNNEVCVSYSKIKSFKSANNDYKVLQSLETEIRKTQNIQAVIDDYGDIVYFTNVVDEYFVIILNKGFCEMTIEIITSDIEIIDEYKYDYYDHFYINDNYDLIAKLRDFKVKGEDLI